MTQQSVYTSTKPKTSWAKPKNPFTNEVDMREVPIPEIVLPRKGRTKYDEQFERMIKFKTAIESTELGFELIRRAAIRFLGFRNLKEAMRIRRRINKKTRMVTMWFESREPK